MSKTYGMTLAKASPADFKSMWKIHKIMQNYGYQFYPEDNDPHAVKMKNILMGRLDQLGTGGFARVVMGCEMLIHEVCDPEADHIALKPVYGAAPDMLKALRRLSAAAFARDTTMGDQCALFAAQAELRDANKQAKTAIKNATGG